jgi:hemerythrin-like domain-containing protein
MRDAGLSLRDHHSVLEERFQQLIARVEEDDPLSLRCEWLLFERELDEHMTIEERELLPLLVREHAGEAEAIRDEHKRIRGTLANLGIAVDLHTLRAADVTAFVQALREHARREERLLYPLTAAEVSPRRLAGLRRRLTSLSSRVAHAWRASRSAN